VPNEVSPSRADWRPILVFYVLACAWSWPFFWWQSAHPASWDAWRIRPELKEFFIQWGPGLAAIAVFYVFPRTRPQFLSLFGSSWRRSLTCFSGPIVVVCIVLAVRHDRRWLTAPYFLTAAGLSCLGEEVGWRGFLQGALRPMGKVRASLLLGLMWTMWHFNPTRDGLISHLQVLLPVTVVVSLVLSLLTDHRGSLLLAAAAHEWLDIGASYTDFRLWIALAAVPFWIWMVWTWPAANPTVDSSKPEAR
jgi:membrane protease YdiL (CAAX protease family)